MKRIVVLLLSAVLLLGLCGCGGNNDITDISYYVNSLPKTIDPQIVSTPEEHCIVRNVFEGLTRINEKGKANLAAAKSYTVSDDKLVYTFKLDETKVWSNAKPVTAHDFVFGMRRAADPATKAADTVRISVISGADEILAGQADVETLGVKALDDYTLQITLKASCPQFLSYLSTPAFMPCNEEFFNETNGKYGLDKKNTIYNGVYYVNGWKKDKNYISVKPSKKYYGEYSPVFESVILQTAGSDTLITDFNEEKIHIIAASRGADLSKYTGYEILNFQNSTCALYISKSFATENMLSALKASVDRNAVAEATGSFVASGYIPGSANIGGSTYHSLSTVPIYTAEYNPDLAYELYVSELSDNTYKGTFPSTSLLYVNEDGMEEIAKKIAAGWQSDLGAFVNIQCVDHQQLSNALAGDNFAFALVPISADSNEAGDYMMSLANSEIFISEDFKAAVGEITYSHNAAEYREKVLAAEKTAIETDNLIPICHLADKYICNSAIYDSLNFINGAFDFTRYQ